MKNVKLVIWFIFLLSTISCDIPQDPKKSWENIVDTQFNVGVVSRIEGESVDFPKTIEREIDLITDFADQHALKLNLVEGSETYLIHKLEAYELDAVIGDSKATRFGGNMLG